MSARRVLLLRHGLLEQEPEGQRRFLGQGDPPLCATGQEQAAAWSAALSGVALGGAYVSDLARCRATAELALAGSAVPVRLEPRLREVNLGGWEGLTVEQVRERFPGEWEHRGADLARYRPHGGECFADVQLRAWAALEDALAASSGDVLLVTHAGVIRSLVCRVLGLPLSRMFGLEAGYGLMTALSLGHGGWSLAGLNLPAEGFLR